jgi:hypothetical protein
VDRFVLFQLYEVSASASERKESALHTKNIETDLSVVPFWSRFNVSICDCPGENVSSILELGGSAYTTKKIVNVIKSGDFKSFFQVEYNLSLKLDS